MSLKIIVVGQPKSGKSTIAYLVEQALNNAGIDTFNHDPDVNEAFEKHALRRIARLADRAVVTIETRQTQVAHDRHG